MKGFEKVFALHSLADHITPFENMNFFGGARVGAWVVKQEKKMMGWTLKH